MSNLIRKLTSRKLWLAAAGVVTGIALAFGADAGEIQTVTGAVTALVSAVTYIITEGMVDAESVANATQSVQEAVETIQGDDNAEQA